jgi:hypothetical protein
MLRSTPRLYADLASWWPLLSAPAEYVDEAAFYTRLIFDQAISPSRTLLELGSGGGNLAAQLKSTFQLTLVDCAPAMLAVSRALNPECEHLEGDMRSVRIDREFDIVLIHDAIVYMTSFDELSQAIETAYQHCRTGGMALFIPDVVRETFKPSTDMGGHDSADRALRYLEWVWDPDPADSTYLADYAYLLRQSDGTVRVEHDRHLCGLFARAEWLEVMYKVGFEARSILDSWGRDAFVAFKLDR